MSSIFFIVFIIGIIFLKLFLSGKVSFTDVQNNLLKEALINQQFYNINTFFSSSSLNILSADSHGENYIFATKNGGTNFSVTDLSIVYDLSRKSHIHNVVIVSSQQFPANSELSRKIKDFNFEVWNNAKIISLLNKTSETSTRSVLRTSDTSYDHCKIDNSSVDPVQYGRLKSHSLLGNIFNRPTRL